SQPVAGAKPLAQLLERRGPADEERLENQLTQEFGRQPGLVCALGRDRPIRLNALRGAGLRIRLAQNLLLNHSALLLRVPEGHTPLQSSAAGAVSQGPATRHS